MIWNSRPIWIIFFHFFFWNIIKFNHSCIALLNCYINIFFFYILDIFSFHMHIALLNRLIVFLSSLSFNTILLTSSVNTLCFLLLNLRWDFNINYYFLWILYDFVEDYLHEDYFFSKWFILFSSWVASKQCL